MQVPPLPARPVAAPLSQQLRSATAALHRQAEGSDLMRALLRGQLPLGCYVQLLRNLHALYQALERALHAAAPAVPALPSGIARAAALESDLHALGGDGWALQAVCPVALAYADHLRALATREPKRLLAHVYVRHLGDLHGGQILKERIARAYGTAVAHAFYRFDQPMQHIAALRALLDAETAPDIMAAIVDEACEAFRRHIELFESLQPPDLTPA
ncbi:biliverdin-producing heme oxygenase [Methyloversatilis thermotolerans]|uniref:biliverdin-producing heme oxygenase n=1 Tax=Methyloversatilis thermotolerans TaxID=1346290 RepID=UPI000684F9FE|nr:biliverdin-producing heme oxygenase [Methyloversatilis thermotolerans]